MGTCKNVSRNQERRNQEGKTRTQGLVKNAFEHEPVLPLLAKAVHAIM